jgi:hypothetical protein
VSMLWCFSFSFLPLHLNFIISLFQLKFACPN